MNDRNYLVALYSFTPFGPKRIELLISFFKTAENVWKAPKSRLIEVGLRQDTVGKFIIYRKNFNFDAYFENLDKRNIKFVTWEDKNYPENLKGLDGAPVVLYYKGDIKLSDKNSVAIIGSRKMTSYGREVANKFAYELSSMGVTIVSGLAMGIDTVAHKGALDAGGRTLGVLGCGLDMIYPAGNVQLAKNIMNGNGAIISEYPIGYPALRNNFAQRNRIVSGLSKAIIVVEGARKSGTLLTASAAAEQGREVFAVPGQITSPMSEAPHFLIKNGVKIAFGVKDILDELDMQLKVDFEEIENVLPKDKEEEKLIKILSNEPLHLDEIARITKTKISEVSSRLVIMEMRGLVKNLGNGIYKKIL